MAGTLVGGSLRCLLKLAVYDLLKMHINPSLPAAATKEIGHGHDSKAIVIGKELVLE